jgi:peroxiredoxin
MVCFGAWTAFQKHISKQDQLVRISTIPSIELVTIQDALVNLSDFKEDVPCVLIYFNSTCPICQSEAELIRKVFSEDQITSFIWISSESITEIRNFRNKNNFERLSNHTFLSDTLFRLASEFKVTTVPATLVYDSKGELVEFFRDGVSMIDLKNAVTKAYESSR